MVGDDARPAIPMDLVISRELEIRGSHGMAAHDYAAMLARVTDGSLQPGRLVGRTIGLDRAPAALVAMDEPPAIGGMTVIVLGKP
jgi:alcohol dehydrogenase